MQKFIKCFASFSSLNAREIDVTFEQKSRPALIKVMTGDCICNCKPNQWVSLRCHTKKKIEGGKTSLSISACTLDLPCLSVSLPHITFTDSEKSGYVLFGLDYSQFLISDTYKFASVLSLLVSPYEY